MVVTGSSFAIAAGQNDGPTLNIQKGQSVTYTVHEEAGVHFVSTLQYYNQGPDKDQPGRGMLQCKSTKDASCNLKDTSTRFIGISVFPPCSASTSDGCVESLDVAPAGAELAPAKFLGVSESGDKMPADPALNFLEGSSASLFEATNAPNAGGTNTYAVVVRALQESRGNKFTLRSLNAAVIPYKDQPDASLQDGNYHGNTCVHADAQTCGAVVDFTEGTQVRVKFRMPSSLGGWFSGRIKGPVMDVAKATDTSSLVTIQGESVTVPTLQKQLSYDEIMGADKEYLTTMANWGGKNGVESGPEGSQSHVFKFIDYFRTKVNDTASSQSTYWSLSTISSGGGSKCLSDTSKIQGIVTTNAIGYDGRAPEFRGGFLNYQVAGLHYAVGGQELAQGSYDLVMRSDTARCLYGFSKAPLYATVSVINDKGSKATATTVVAEKNGWLRMAAYGFTYSKKIIKVKITKKKK